MVEGILEVTYKFKVGFDSNKELDFIKKKLKKSPEEGFGGGGGGLGSYNCQRMSVNGIIAPIRDFRSCEKCKRTDKENCNTENAEKSQNCTKYTIKLI